jgi:hypothetical protein
MVQFLFRYSAYFKTFQSIRYFHLPWYHHLQWLAKCVVILNDSCAIISACSSLKSAIFY